jgi:hypothetical protein
MHDMITKNWMVSWISAVLFLGSMANAKDSVNLLSDPDFKQPKEWNLQEGYSIVPMAGMDGQSALCVERSDSSRYVLNSVIVDVIPGRSYEFGAYVKGENIRGSATICAELLDSKGNYLEGGIYARGKGGTFDWTLINDVLPIPKGVTSCRLVFYLESGAVGKAFFSKPYIREVPVGFDAYILCPSMPTSIHSGKQTIVFGTILPNEKRSYDCRIVLRKDGKDLFAQQVPVKQGRIESTFDVPTGAFEFRLDLLEKNRSVGQVEIPAGGITSYDEIPVRIDDRGRTWVKGKKYFPIGLYFTHELAGEDTRLNLESHDLRKDLALVADSPFNCVIPYDGLFWRTDPKISPSVSEIKKLLDYCESRHLKVIFPFTCRPSEFDGMKGEKEVMKYVINSVKDHPSILAWYVNDEDPVKLRPEFIERNQFINQMDSGHPTWAVFCCVFDHITMGYGGIATVYGMDAYPINLVDERKNQREIARQMDVMNRTFANGKGISLWSVPQIFNWGVYNAQGDVKKFRTFRYPSEVEIRSMILLELISGVKGIVMYSFFDLFAGPDKDQFTKRWPEVCRVAKLVQELQGYILGDPDGPAIRMKTETGDVRAKGFTNDDNLPVVLISSIGPGPSKAVISVKTDQNLRSLFGRTIKQPDGTWLYTGQDIDSDALVPVAAQF